VALDGGPFTADTAFARQPPRSDLEVAIDRRGILRAETDSGIMLMGVESPPGAPIRSDMVVGRLPGLRAFIGATNAITLVRSGAHLKADGSDDLVLIVNSSGLELVKTRRREVELGAGVATLLPADEAFTIERVGSGGGQALRVPRAALATLAPRMTDLVARPIGPESPPLRLLTSYLGALAHEVAPTPPELKRAIVSHVHDLVALTVAGARDGPALAREQSVVVARLQVVKDDIALNLTSPDLSGPALAARHRMTPRHLRRLFETEGTTFSAYVLSHRLARAHAMLCNPRLAPYAIAAIAYECGFGDVSYFNQAFRRAYAARPSDVRAAALAGPTEGRA